MKQKLFLLFFVAFFSWHANAESLVYVHEGLHLYFTIDTETKEAILGNAFSTKEQNAIAYPPLTDPWWNANPQLNLWRDVVIPSTINCEGTAYTNDGGTRTIDKGTYTVVGVSSNAFYRSTYVYNVQLPETVTTIGSGAFSWCTFLRSITLPSQLTAIASSTFNLCKDLESIHLPSNITSIGPGAFSDCALLKEIRIPGSCTSIGDDAFMGCSALHKVIIEDGTAPLNVGSSFGVSVMYESLDENKMDLQPHRRGLFGDCNIDTLYLGRNIIYPYGYDWKSTTSSQWTNRRRPFPPFEKCSEYRAYIENYFYSGFTLKSLEFGETLTDIPDSLFASTNIKCELSLPSNLKRIGKRAFYLGANYIEHRKVEIPQSVEYIGEEAFRGNYLSEVIFHESLKTIDNYAFYDNNISSLTIPSTITYYGTDPFGKNNITSLHLTEGLKTMCSISDAKIVELTIPESIENIGGSYGKSLRFIHCNPTTPPDGMTGNGAIVYVPAGTAPAYRAKGWTNIIDPDEPILTINVKTAGSLYSRILAQDFQLGSVFRLKIKGTLNEDDWATINNMNHLYDLDLSETNIEELPSGFFQNNTKLNKLTFPNTLRSIEDEAFTGCVNLGGDIIIPQSCTTIGNRAFYGLNFSKLICNEVVNIHEEAFMNCSCMKEVQLAQGTTVGENAFSSTAIEELYIPANVIIGDKAFNSITLKKVTFDGGGQEIGNNVFEDTVEKYTFNGSVKKIGTFAQQVNEVFVDNIYTWCTMPFYHPVKINNLFINNEEANNIIIPNGVKTLRNFLFYDCPTIQTIQLSDDITEIPDRAFKGCTNLATVILPAKLKVIGDSAFAECNGLQQIDLPSKVVSIGSCSFANCVQLSRISLPASLTTIRSKALFNCTSLSSLFLPENLLTIENGAFAECTSLEKLDFPASIVSIGEGAFSNCTGVTLIVTHWKEPIVVSNLGTISDDGCLYVPIGLSQKYVNAGWNFRNLKERGILTIRVSNGGKAICDGVSVSDNTIQLYFSPYRDIPITISPDEGYTIVKTIMNGNNVTADIENGNLSIEEAEEDINLYIVFGTEDFLWGDANGDHILNNDDVITIANKIIKNNPAVFNRYAADINDDGIINIIDIHLVIKEIKEKGDSKEK